MMETEELRVHVDRGVGRLTLNRPQALHALTTGMCATMSEALEASRDDPAVRAVLLDHAEGTRGFCAGGDIRKVAQSGRGDGRDAADFFRIEYTLNTRIKAFPKPFIAVLDGITMGGGVGISVHGSHRIATEKTIFAMPETGIGLFPDVGGGWFLPRLSGELGTWLALTGAQVRGGDVVAAGLATHFVPSDRIGDLKAAIIRDGVGAISGQPVATPAFAEHAAVIDRCFAGDSVQGIVDALHSDGGDWAKAQADILMRRSPLSLTVSLRQLRAGRRMTSFAEVMRMEYRIACHITRSNDFSEGVRAVIEDKDNAPRWSPQSLDAVGEDLVERMFAPLGDAELQLPEMERL